MHIHEQIAPFLMLKAGVKETDGNDRFEGYCVDLLEEIANQWKGFK